MDTVAAHIKARTRDPGWPAVAAQLIDRAGSGGPAAAAATAALAVAQVLVVLDGAARPGGPEPAPVPPVLGATLELDLDAGVLLRRPWPGHPGCTCGAPLRATSGRPTGQETIRG